MDFTISNDFNQLAKIKVFGVGGGGGNAVQHMINGKLIDIEFICANTDAQALERSNAEHKIQLGPQLTKGLGAGAKPEIGQKAAEESMQEIAKFLQDTDMVFITAGMGGGTGTGAAPVIAKMAKEKGILTVGVVTRPFSIIEGKRVQIANKGIEELRQHVDSLITIPNDRLRAIAPKKATAKEMFMKANDVLLSAVRGVTEVITKPGFINLDFADIKTAMSMQGSALMGEGIASGENRAADAARQAICSPLLEDISITGAKALLINITGSDITMDEFSEVGEYIHNAALSDNGEMPEVFIGIVDSENLNDEIRVTVIATGIEPEEQSVPTPSSGSQISFNSTKAVAPTVETPVAVVEEEKTSPRMNIQRKPFYDNDNYESAAFMKNRHTPGAEDFTFDSETDDIPTFIRRQAN